MVDIKATASIILPGRVLQTEHPCSKNGKKLSKEELEKNYDQMVIKMETGSPLVVNLRRTKPAKLNVPISVECFNHYTDPQNPAPGIKLFEWKKLSINKRFKYHLMAEAHDMGGKLESFSYLE